MTFSVPTYITYIHALEHSTAETLETALAGKKKGEGARARVVYTHNTLVWYRERERERERERGKKEESWQHSDEVQERI